MSYVQENFNRAVVEYEKAKEIIEELSNVVRSVNPGFSAEIAQREFDLILQCILINVAISDGNFSDIESQFIEKITTYGDVLAFARAKMDIPALNWENVQLIGQNSQRQLMRMIEDELNIYIDNFVQSFAAINIISTKKNIKDYHQLLGIQIIKVASALMKIDGVSEKVEEDALLHKIANLFDSKWFAAENKLK